MGTDSFFFFTDSLLSVLAVYPLWSHGQLGVNIILCIASTGKDKNSKYNVY